MDFVYTYKGNRCSFVLENIKGLKTKTQFEKVFKDKVNVDEVWEDVENARADDKKKVKKEGGE